MRLRALVAALAVAAVGLGIAAFAMAGDSNPGFNHLTATLSGYQEVPAISSTGSATFTADVAQDGQSVDWQMTYGGIEGNVLQSHIHFGQRSVNGGISVFLCTNLGNGPAGTQPCPQSGTISGSFAAADVIGPAAQGITAGQYAELIKAIAAGKAYANIHSSIWPGGEIRAQLNEGDPHN
jgi:CHRD domain-containing protein